MYLQSLHELENKPKNSFLFQTSLVSQCCYVGYKVPPHVFMFICLFIYLIEGKERAYTLECIVRRHETLLMML